MLELPSTDLQREGRIGEVDHLLLLEVTSQIGGGGVERSGRSRREREQLPRAGRAGGWQRRRLFEHDVGVGASHTEGAHRRSPRGRPSALPLTALAVHEEGAAFEVDLGLGRW